MMSLRAVTRAIPGRGFTAATSRGFSTIPKFRSVQGRSGALSSAFKVRRGGVGAAGYNGASRAFSVSGTRFESAGQVDAELSAKMEQEISLERESKDPEQMPVGLMDFVENSGFEVTDTPGHEEVILTRKFGDETVKITFSIADLNALNEDPDQISEDSALADEDIDDDMTPQSGGASTKGAINQGQKSDGNFAVAPEDSIAPADRPELADENGAADEDAEDSDMSPGFPTRVNVTITKPGKGAIQLETVAQDGLIDIENVYYFTKADLADAQTAEKDFKRHEIYAGPPFSNLDEELQILFERYLDERGVNAGLASFVPDYVDWKEQREYVRWLGDVKTFIDA